MKGFFTFICLTCVLVVPCLDAEAAIPPHRAVLLSGLHAYADPLSVAAGDTVRFHVSSTVPYQLLISRMGGAVDDPSGDEEQLVYTFPDAPANVQPIYPGSYIHVEAGLAPQEPIQALTLECWVRPWRTDAWAGLITQYDFPAACGIGLFLGPDGTVAFYLGDGMQYDSAYRNDSPPGSLVANRWQHVVATWDGEQKIIWIDGKEVGRWPFRGPVAAGMASLRLAAYSSGGVADQFLDGDLAMPVIYNRALSGAEVAARFADKGRTAVTGADVLACWPFVEEQGERVADVSGRKRDGQIINHATWMIGGPSFKADVPRFGSYDPKTDATRGHGIRFASDDLYDCGWSVTHEYRVPENARPGIYVARFSSAFATYAVTFVVKKARQAGKAPILVLCSTNTWRAYNNIPFPQPMSWLRFSSNEFVNSPGNSPAFSLYRFHAAGQGTYQMGLRLPWPFAGPYVTYGAMPTYSHLVRAERFLHAWLEREGYRYDVVTDLDLHRDPDLLTGYQVVVINGHSEYWSIPAYQGVERYLRNGGNLLCLSGNTMFWRVSFNEDGTVMECRKVDTEGACEMMPPERRGEAWHSQDGQRGGLLRDCGYPAWKLVGLETLGWHNAYPEQFGSFRVEKADHFLFTTPDTVGVKKGDVFAIAANGHEFDVRPSTIASVQQEPTPSGGTVPGDPAGITLLARGTTNRWDLGGKVIDYFARPVTPKGEVGGEVVYWERPEGGRVFNAGFIGAGWALSADSRLQRLVRNVLFHFGVAPGPNTSLSADFNRDGRVDFDDFFMFAAAFGQKATGDNARYDLDGNGVVDFSDFFVFAEAFGKKR